MKNTKPNKYVVHPILYCRMNDIVALDLERQAELDWIIRIYLKSSPSSPMKVSIYGSHDTATDIFKKCRDLWLAWGNGETISQVEIGENP